jgi:hypothetical protein
MKNRDREVEEVEEGRGRRKSGQKSRVLRGYNH